jgi:hypothetical protein
LDGQNFTITFPDNPIAAYRDGLPMFVIFDNDVTVAAPTINPDALGAHTIQFSETLGVSPYDIRANDLIHMVYDEAVTAWIALNRIPCQELCFAQADQSVVITTGTNKLVFPNMPACTILYVRGALKLASSSGVVTFDANDGATTFLSTKLTMDANEDSSYTASIPAVISVRSHAANWTFRFDIDTAGTGATGWIFYIGIRKES